MKFNSLIPELAVFNISDSLFFYVGVLGFSIKYQRKEEGFAFLQLGNSQLMLDEIGRGRTWRTADFVKPLGRGINLQIEVGSIVPLLERLKNHKIGLFLRPEDKWYGKGKSEFGNRQFIVQDPNGYLLRFFQDIGKRKIRV